MKANAILRNLRIAPRKVHVVADLVRGLKIEEALIRLDAVTKKARSPLKKLIESAIANGENNFGMDRNNLYVQDIRVGAGATLKRWMPRAHGRATQILKRTSQIEVILGEIEEGKNRKSPEQLAKARKDREQARERERKQFQKELTEGRKETEEKVSDITTASRTEEKAEKREVEKKRKQEKLKGWTSKIFRRKSV